MKIVLAAMTGLAMLPFLNAEGQTQIALTDVQIERLGISSAQVEQRDQVVLGRMNAEIIRSKASVNSVFTPYAGALVSIHVQPGEYVEAGQVIATLRSQELVELKLALAKAKSEEKLLSQIVERETSLVEIGLSPSSNLTEAKANLALSKSDVSRLQSQINAFSKTIRSQQNGFDIIAEKSGQIISIPMSVGDSVSAMDAVALLSSSAPAWAEIHVPVRFMNNVANEDLIVFRSGQSEPILSIASEIDPETRSGLVYAAVPEDSALRVGQFTEIQLVKRLSDTVAIVPSVSVVQIDGQDYVFRQNRASFELIPVEFMSRSGHDAVVSGTLSSGDLVAIHGLSELKSLAMAEME
jgi:cobalt-zinc-cadmium efflux system membrane fusion protein